MTSGQQSAILKNNPEGYITDILGDSTTAIQLNAEDTQLKFIDLPAFRPKQPLFTIETYQSFDTINHTVTDTQLPNFPVDDGVEQYVILKYYERDFQTVGEKVWIKYTGKPNIPLMPQYTLLDEDLYGIWIRDLV